MPLCTQADADGATDITDLERLIPVLESSAVSVGSGSGSISEATLEIGDKLGMVVGSR